MPSLLLLALSLQSAPVALPAPPPRSRLGVEDAVDCAETPGALACRKGSARFRLPIRENETFDRKADGLRQDGRQCGLVGPKVCTRKPRTILSTAPKE